MSPIHVAAMQAAKETEDLVQEALRENGWATRQMPELHEWDLEAKKPKLFMAKKSRLLLVEVKRRKLDWGQYPTIFIDVAKVTVMQAEAAAQTTDMVTAAPVFVVVANDLIPRFAWLTEPTVKRWGTNTKDVQAWRGDPDDKGDAKYDIPLLDFHRLSL